MSAKDAHFKRLDEVLERYGAIGSGLIVGVDRDGSEDEEEEEEDEEEERVRVKKPAGGPVMHLHRRVIIRCCMPMARALLIPSVRIL